MKVLSLNCQKDYRPGLEPFLRKIMAEKTYEILLLQEASQSVVDIFASFPNYSVLNVFDERVSEQSQVAIVYSSDFTLRDHRFLSFARMAPNNPDPFKHISFGLLLGVFEREGREYAFCSVHLSSGGDAKVRLQEVKLLKQFLPAGLPTLFGGDFNFGVPGERARAIRCLAPEFKCFTQELGGTLNSRFSEPADHLPARFAVAAARFGLGVRLKADHFFANSLFSEGHLLTCCILPDRVSDHSPIEIVIS